MVRVFLGTDVNSGKRLYHNKTIHGNKNDATAYLTAYLRDRDLGAVVPGKATVDVLLDDLLADYRVNGKRIDWAGIVVEKHLRPFFGKMLIERVGSSTITEYVSDRQKAGVKSSTINRELALLRRAFNLGRISTPPKVARMPQIRAFKENNVRKGFFEDSDFRAIRASLPDEIKPIVTFGYFTGCRKGEILALKWHQVDLAEGVVRLDPGTTKNDEGRLIPLVPELIEMLAMRKALRDREYPSCEWVFFRDGESILDFRGAWKAACATAGLVDENGTPTKLFHDLRRTGVRNLVRAGVPERVVMAISGHKTRAIFDRYNIVSEADLRSAAVKLGMYVTEKRTQSEGSHTAGTQAQPTDHVASQAIKAKLLN